MSEALAKEEALTKEQLAGIVEFAKKIEAERGIGALINYKYYSDACACLGPRFGEPFCRCAMRAKLDEYLVTVLREFNPAAGDEALALRVRKAQK